MGRVWNFCLAVIILTLVAGGMGYLGLIPGASINYAFFYTWAINLGLGTSVAVIVELVQIAGFLIPIIYLILQLRRR